MKKSLFSYLALLAIIGCSSYPFETQNAQNAFYMGDFDRAANLLDGKSKDDGKDQLLYLFDRGTALQLAGKYDESSRDWLKADKMSEVKDYTSLSTEAATLLTSENIKQYKGEDFEKVIINAFIAINYLMLHNYEEALVECRRVNQKLYRYKSEAKKNYEQNPFARYLSAMIWEATGNYDDAYIDYVETHKLVPDFHHVKLDLLRLSKRLQREEDYAKWRSEFSTLSIPTAKEEKSTGEIILIFQQGKTAVKRPHPVGQRFAKFYPRFSTSQRAKMEIDGKSELSEKIYSVSDVAIKTLDDAFAGLLAKKAVGVAAKAVVADQVRQQSPILGILAWIGLNAADQADLRQWMLLPESLQFSRMRVTTGNKTVKVFALDSAGNPDGEEKTFIVDLKPGQKIFLNWRSLK